MIDVAILEAMAKPAGVVIGPRPLQLEEVFARVVADGWVPRNPCTDPQELEQLEASRVRGHCISPLAVDGDTLFIDPTGSPLPGDLVSFRLSARGAAAQNSCLPEGQAPARPGDAWCKLFLKYRSFPMLLDRFGNSATATLLSCEYPDDAPVLHPVRNIARAGRLLITPDNYASGLGLNAASQIASTFVTSDSIVASPGSGSGTGMTTAASLNNMTGAPVAIDLSVGQTLLTVNGAVSAFSFTFAIYRDGASIGSSVTTAVYDSTQFPPSAGINLPISPLMLSIVDPTPPSGFHTYRLYLSSYSVTGGTSVVINFKSVTMKAREVKR